MITQEQVKKLFDYRNGELYWMINPCKNVKIGDMAGSLNNKGYKRTSINKKIYSIHRLIFLMHYGYLPQCLDHIDGNKTNNKIENLREATPSQNCYNAKKSIINTSGVKGVSWDSNNKKWRVRFWISNIQKDFGSYYDIKVAKFIAETMRYKYHNAFANHGGVE